ncbi:hemagglutinin/amebocyte aggregation factor [Aplysia californica]|uniref:Hemagglutinin/amebocyte aggregation factor n=1 Tax=Aplysia californica TaxID=6500 RepID=A0ABM1VUC4_APLCA|nr:hemagglutinin/amebocyte aggregation factor [Aplysia californica]
MELELTVVLVVLLPLASGVSWMTDYDQQFTYECPEQHYLQTIESVHDNHKEDRVFNFGCAPMSTFFSGNELDSCEWTGYVNDFDALMEFQCHNDYIIAGISSYHDNGKEDRRFKFQCCKPGSLVAHACSYTAYINTYDHVLQYRVPDGYAIRGVNSIHDNGKEDRIFKFDICKLDKLQGPIDGEVVG